MKTTQQSWIDRTVIIFSILVTLVNCFFLFTYCMRKYSEYRALGNYLEPGSQFASFKEFTSAHKWIGYITNKQTSREHNDGFYLQAQYYLAPTIIDLGNADYPLVIVDSLDFDYIVNTIKILKGKRLANTEYGQALILRPPEP